ncbi:MAG: hypothetical protein A3A98_02665 [Candidatus Staskawiczbacteria bacterium RIFCSPLOWO2_01_FULL_40_39]|uniref:EfeO-type cupredoxin-like domain-containing protein n=1 Tax=Candidatus Staskawiczbacteria bacterium RIFCSPHIGHO2_01_FULL_39_25 TaxID=1802202 RepID=A0A1G2HPT8_9BACT|nr:MAG: hypothetical protein A2730_02390 [Candidatus Staskawiczbacteria bacterium RIFCSPHIGHO2_01_FULL_39_25]OGZ73651.1 MAG: hypothetical protein A3A98_02665 [Candidatus Staskawiczbacteria bacterium RIFCSPLOWO2_01_FULL_40_39]
MNQKNNLIPYLSIGAIIVTALISGYIILKPNDQTGNQTQNANGLAPIVNGKQVIQMTVKAVSYSPNFFKVKAGVPVRWEITSSGQPGCASGAIFSSILPNGSVYLNPNQGQVTLAEFTPQSPGTYRFSCSMNMAKGTIEVAN